MNIKKLFIFSRDKQNPDKTVNCYLLGKGLKSQKQKEADDYVRKMNTPNLHKVLGL